MTHHPRYRLPLLSALAMLVMPAGTALAQATAASVVQITCGSKTGVGVAWLPAPNAEPHIVTTLHLVAGRPTCNITNSRRRTTSAEISGVYYPADLALMKPRWSDDFGSGDIVPLQEGTLTSAKATYFRFLPNGQVQTRPIGLDPNSVNTALANLHPRLLEPAFQQAFQKNLCQQPVQYPALDAKIYKLGNPVKPGDSGSPIIQGDRIVGLIDGGYTVGVAPAYWSIDTRHFGLLYPSSSQPPPVGTTCANKASQLYSADVPEIPRIGDVDLEPLYSTNFGELFADMDEEDQAEVRELAVELELSPQQLAPNVIDVYQDGATGAIIALPRGFNISPQQDKDLSATYIEVMNPSEDLAMIVFVENDYDAYEDPEEYADRGFLEHLAEETGSDWLEDEEQRECYADELYCERSFETYFELDEYDDDGDPVAVIGAAMLTTDEHDLLAMAFFAKSNARKRAAADFIVMMMCLDLADFAYF